MHVITRKRLQEFWQIHTDAEQPLRVWLALVRAKRYETSSELKRDFPSVSFLGRWRTIFNIGGNKYRLVVDVRYDLGRIYIRHVLTHKEYNRLTRENRL